MVTCKGRVVCFECKKEFGEHRAFAANVSSLKLQLLDLVGSVFELFEQIAPVTLPESVATALKEAKEEADAAEFMLMQMARESVRKEEEDV